MEFFRLGAEEKARFYQKILLEVGRLAPIMLIDADGNFIFASDAFLTDMGLEAEDLRHKSAYDLVAEKYYDRSPSLKALAEGKDCGELSESKDGFPVYTETKLLRNEQGEVEYALCHSLKPASIDHEVELLRHQVAYYRGEVAELKNRLRSGPQTIYQSEAMRRSIVTADRVAKADTAVMLTGESGVGKDLMARHIHERSARSGKPFVPVCIPMMSPSLLESELFGYVEGAFTGSMRKGKTGLFEAANGGTVFLDEVGDIPLELQVKLLRVLENQEIIRVGGTEPTHLDIRIISATNRDIPSMVEQGLFREDLYYRLGVIQLRIPPLRERTGDVPLLADFFLHKLNQKYHSHKCLAPGALSLMERYDWPGNVRQLRNVVEQSVVLSDGDFIREQDISRLIRGMPGRPPVSPSGAATGSSTHPVPVPEAASAPDVVSEASRIERQQIVDALVRAHGNKKKAAELLGISRSKLYRRLNTF